MRFIFFLVCSPALLFSQSISVPHSGMTFDTDSKTFRPVLGVPGASMLGDSVEIRGELHNVTICSQQQFALAAAGRDGIVTLLHLDTLKTTEVAPALIAWPSQIALSEGCTAAATYSAVANRLQIVTGLPSKPVVAADLSPDFPVAVSSLAISDDGQLAIAVVPGKAVYLVPASGRAVTLLPLQKDAVVAMHGNQEAIVADRFGNTVNLISNLSGSPSLTLLAGPDRGIDSPIAVRFDDRSQNVVVANSGNGKINLLTLSGSTSSVVECGCELSSLSPLTDRTYQLQAAASGQPLRILDLGSTPPRVVFVASPEPHSFPKGRHNDSSEAPGR